MAGLIQRIIATLSDRFQFDCVNDGPLWRSVGQAIEARNGDDDDYTIVRGATPVGPNDLTPLQFVQNAIQTVLDAAEPAFFLLLQLGDYTEKFTFASEVIQYTRVFLPAGAEIINGVTFIVQGSGGKNIRLGLYTQPDPTDRTQTPTTKVRETAQTGTSGLNNEFLFVPWTAGSYVVPTTGFYWVAFVVNDSPDIMRTPNEYEEGYLPRYEQSTSGTNLPNTASVGGRPKSAVALCGLERQL